MQQFARKLAIIIVNYRTADLAIDCLVSLSGQEVVPDDTCIVVVDGKSDDGSAEKISAAIMENRWANVTCLALDHNGGFACGNNRGIEHALEHFGRPEYILLLNPDTIARPGSVNRLVEFMEKHADAGIAGSSLEHPDGRKQACAFRFPSITNEFEAEARLGPVTYLLNQWRIAPEMPKGPSRIDWVSGASLIFRSGLLDEIGYLDEQYFLYYEEVDFCIRAAKAGWSCWHVPQSRVIHLVGQSTGVTRYGRPSRRPAYWFQSRRRYYIKHCGALYAQLANLSWLCGHLAWRLRLALSGRPANLPPHILSDFIRHAQPFRKA